MGAKTKLQLKILEFFNVFFYVFMYFEILKTVINWTLKSNVVLFENKFQNVPFSVKKLDIP